MFLYFKHGCLFILPYAKGVAAFCLLFLGWVPLRYVKEVALCFLYDTCLYCGGLDLKKKPTPGTVLFTKATLQHTWESPPLTKNTTIKEKQPGTL